MAWGLGFRVYWFAVKNLTGLLSNQGEKSKNCYFIMVPVRKKYESMVLQSPVKDIPLTSSSEATQTHTHTQKPQKCNILRKSPSTHSMVSPIVVVKDPKS